MLRMWTCLLLAGVTFACVCNFAMTDLREQRALLRRSSLDPERRRLSLGAPAAAHRASDACLDPHHAAILFRDSRGVKSAYSVLEAWDRNMFNAESSEVNFSTWLSIQLAYE
ncbi:Uncharacterized protein GBIM_11578 [Gryllus bimaculatus]|nr:Uncharacterized protein GBIM_11578 [Gryllus bimaculatus]